MAETEKIENLEEYFSAYWKRLTTARNGKVVRVEFYKYRSTYVKVFRKEYGALLRYNSRLEAAPEEVLKAGGREMLHRILRKRPLATDKVIFKQFLSELPPDDEIIKNARPLLPPEGKHVNLRPVYERVVKEYFNSEVEVTDIGWSRKPVKSYLAHYRKDLDRITFNKALDSQKVPGFLLEYLMYHELLHVVFPARFVAGRWRKHSSDFKAREREFPEYSRARAWIKKNSSRLGYK